MLNRFYLIKYFRLQKKKHMPWSESEKSRWKVCERYKKFKFPAYFRKVRYPITLVLHDITRYKTVFLPEIFNLASPIW
jgi:hypothetical protein